MFLCIGKKLIILKLKNKLDKVLINEINNLNKKFYDTKINQVKTFKK